MIDEPLPLDDDSDAVVLFDDLGDRDSFGAPGVRFRRGDALVLLRRSTFDAILRTLHDLWWLDRRIGRLAILDDWLADRGAFDPDAGVSRLADLAAFATALTLARERAARDVDLDDRIDDALAALRHLSGEEIDGDTIAVEPSG